jgi:hypothetical protein
MMQYLLFLLASLWLVFPYSMAQANEQLAADPLRSYVLETEVTVVVTIHGNQWVLQAQFTKGDVLDASGLAREAILRPKWAQLHFGPHVDVAFRVPAGPRVPPAFMDHVSYEASDLQVRFTPSPDPRRRELLVRLSPFVANGKTYRVKAPGGDENPIPLLIRVPLP